MFFTENENESAEMIISYSKNDTAVVKSNQIVALRYFLKVVLHYLGGCCLLEMRRLFWLERIFGITFTEQPLKSVVK